VEIAASAVSADVKPAKRLFETPLDSRMTRIDLILTIVPTAAYKTLVLFEKRRRNHRWQSPQSRIHLAGLSSRSWRANDLDCGRALLRKTNAQDTVRAISTSVSEVWCYSLWPISCCGAYGVQSI